MTILTACGFAGNELRSLMAAESKILAQTSVRFDAR